MPGSPIEAVILDLEGTLYAHDRLLPGTAGVVEALRSQGLRLRFMTNVDSTPPERIKARLQGWGLDVRAGELFSPVAAAQRYITAGSRIYALTSLQLRDCFPSIAHEPPYSHVLVADCRETLDYAALDGAFRAVRSGAELLALQRGRYFTRADGDHLDTGAIVAALEYATGKPARVLGKPSRDYFQLVTRSLGAAPAQCVVVGDDATTDIAGGRAAGLRTVQVRTGKYADQAAAGLTGEADHELDSISGLPPLLDELVTR